MSDNDQEQINEILYSHPSRVTVSGTAMLQREVASLREQLVMSMAVSSDWRIGAWAWLMDKADKQAAINKKHPAHVACYPEWESAERALRWYASEVLTTSFAAPAQAVVDDVVRDAVTHCATLAHMGGMNEDALDILCAIRKITLPWFDGSGTRRQCEQRVTRAMIFAAQQQK